MAFENTKVAKSIITTIKLEKKTKERLEKFRTYKRETYDEIVQELLGILNVCRVDPDKARDRLMGINRKVRVLAKNEIVSKKEVERSKVKGKIRRFK